MTLPDPVDTLERFAEISAQLDDPFTEEEDVLRALGLDAETWDRIEARWLLRLRAEDAAELGKRFGQAYRDAVHRLLGVRPSAEEIADTEPEGPGFLTPNAQPWRAEAAAVGRGAMDAPPPLLAAPGPAAPRAGRAAPPLVADVDDTLDNCGPLPVPLMPFQPPSQADDDGPGETLPLGAVLPKPALPFPSR